VFEKRGQWTVDCNTVFHLTHTWFISNHACKNQGWKEIMESSLPEKLYTPLAVVSHARKDYTYQPLLHMPHIRMFRRKRALWSSASEMHIGVTTVVRPGINDISITSKLKQ
jgi:hypothetical protein